MPYVTHIKFPGNPERVPTKRRITLGEFRRYQDELSVAIAKAIVGLTSK